MIKSLLKIALSPVKAVVDTGLNVAKSCCEDPAGGILHAVMSPLEASVRTLKDVSDGINDITKNEDEN